LGSFRKNIWLLFPVAVLIAVTVGAAFHDIPIDHDRETCQLCTWLQQSVCLVAPFTLLIFFTLQLVQSEPWLRPTRPALRFSRSRSPPSH